MKTRTRGVADTVAVTLLVFVAVILTTLAYVYIVNYVTAQLSNLEKRVPEFFSIESICMKGVFLHIYVRNYGKVPVKITEVDIFKYGGQLVRKYFVSVDVEPGEVEEIVVCAPLNKGTYIVEVVSETGHKASTIFTVR